MDFPSKENLKLTLNNAMFHCAIGKHWNNIKDKKCYGVINLQTFVQTPQTPNRIQTPGQVQWGVGSEVMMVCEDHFKEYKLEEPSKIAKAEIDPSSIKV